jgi:hypothetical protein
LVFVFEFLLLFRLVGRDSVYDGAGSGDLFKCVAEPARFYGSTGGISLGKEEEDHILAVQVLQGDGLAQLVGQGELGGFIIDL